MSNELPVRNRLSSLNNDNNGSHYSHITCESYLSNRSSHVDSNESHYSSINHHSNHSNYDQTMIGRDFASDILVADLAIRSTAYMPPEQGQTPPPSPTKRSVTPNMDNKKAKRRVTFKDDKELQTIFVYSSSSFISSASEMSPADNEEEEEEEELYLDLPREESILELPPSPPSLPPSPSPSPSPLPSTSALPERISKKASYDALHYRKQIRRNSQRPSTSTSEPGYWYPLSPSSRSLKDNMVRHGTLPLPELRSLEMTEKLISESIQREMALNPNLLQPCSAPAEPTRELSPHSSPKPQPMMINNDAVSVLITDTDDDAENEHTDEEKEYIDTEEDGSIETTSSISEQSIENVIQHINSVHINDEQLNTRHSVTSFCSNYIEDEEDEEESDTSVATSSPQPQSNELQMQQENQDMQESDFSKSVFNELAKRHEQTMISFPEYQSPPFEQNIVPLSAMDNVLFIPPKPQPVQIDNDSVWIDYPTLMNHQPTSNAKGLFFVKVLKAENLDFPIDNDNIKIYCSIRHKSLESRSYKQKMTHTMTIDHEMRIEHVDPNEKISITIHVAATKTNQSSGWYHRIKPASDLERYVHEKDGSICQTLFSPNRFMENGPLDQTASLMLVNSWYKTSSSSTTTAKTPLLRLRKTTSLQRKNNLAPEKAVGKIYIQCLYVKTRGNYMPRKMEEAIEALNANRFHQTDWQAGYMSQIGGNIKCLTKRYFTLTGGCLFAYEQDDKPHVLYKLPLSRATKLICDNLVIAEKPQKKSPTTLLNQLESLIMMSDDDDDKETRGSTIEYPEESFYLAFDNGNKIQFQCESVEERNKWVSVIEVMICKLPPLPDWIIT